MTSSMLAASSSMASSVTAGRLSARTASRLPVGLRTCGRRMPLGLPLRAEPDNGKSRNSVSTLTKPIQDAVKDIFPGSGSGGLPKKTEQMIDMKAPQVPPIVSAFTRRREVWVGRLAMFGMVAEIIGEMALRTGPVGQLEYILGWSRPTVALALVALVAFNGITALNPASPTWSDSNQQDVKKRPAGPVQDSKLVPGSKEYLGVTGWGFSKANEVFVGRVAMLGFAAGTIADWFMNKGFLAQVASYAGYPDVGDGFYKIAGLGIVGSAVLVTILSYALDNKGEDETGKDIY